MYLYITQNNICTLNEKSIAVLDTLIITKLLIWSFTKKKKTVHHKTFKRFMVYICIV